MDGPWFDEVPPRSRKLRPHVVMHGRSTGYGTAENSAKVLFALDLLASLVDDVRLNPEKAEAS